jgi:hypothetical protein
MCDARLQSQPLTPKRNHHLAETIHTHNTSHTTTTTSDAPLLSPKHRQLLTAKPVVYLVNVSAKDYARKKNKHLPKIFEWVQVRRACGRRRRRRRLAERGVAGLLVAQQITTRVFFDTLHLTPSRSHYTHKLTKTQPKPKGARRRPHHPVQRQV